MSYQSSTYTGDSEYCIPCTGDVCVGDEIRFERATFSGSYSKPKFAGFEQITGEVIRDSYGKDKQQHTFSIQVGNDVMLIKGRNVYANGTFRKAWTNEQLRHISISDKHVRGDMARATRDIRRAEHCVY